MHVDPKSARFWTWRAPPRARSLFPQKDLFVFLAGFPKTMRSKSGCDKMAWPSLGWRSCAADLAISVEHASSLTSHSEVTVSLWFYDFAVRCAYAGKPCKMTTAMDAGWNRPTRSGRPPSPTAFEKRWRCGIDVGLSGKLSEARDASKHSGRVRSRSYYRSCASPIMSATLPSPWPTGFGDPVVVSRAVWCSISESISAPIRMTIAEIHSQVIKPMTAPSEP